MYIPGESDTLTSSQESNGSPSIFISWSPTADFSKKGTGWTDFESHKISAPGKGIVESQQSITNPVKPQFVF